MRIGRVSTVRLLGSACTADPPTFAWALKTPFDTGFTTIDRLGSISLVDVFGEAGIPVAGTDSVRAALNFATLIEVLVDWLVGEVDLVIGLTQVPLFVVLVGSEAHVGENVAKH
jgi:hypothetical protein